VVEPTIFEGLRGVSQPLCSSALISGLKLHQLCTDHFGHRAAATAAIHIFDNKLG
jgi:hypothetical protein